MPHFRKPADPKRAFSPRGLPRPASNTEYRAVYDVGRRPNSYFRCWLRGGHSEASAYRAVQWLIARVASCWRPHERDLMHRDLKPSNIIIGPDGEPVVMDFGLARSASGADRMTRTGVGVGTEVYMSPEQHCGDPASIGLATDIWALGVMLYELLTGLLPFRPGGVKNVIIQIIQDDPEPPSRVRPGLDLELDVLCLKALAKKPAERFASMKGIAAELAAYAKGRADTLVQPETQRSSPVEPPPVQVVCPHCQHKMTVATSAVGKQVRCAHCGEPFSASNVLTATWQRDVPPLAAPDRPTPRLASQDTVRDRRKSGHRLLALATVSGVVLAVGAIWFALAGQGRTPPKDPGQQLAHSSQDTERASNNEPAKVTHLPAERPSKTPEPERSVPPTPKKETHNSVAMTLVLIEPGTFQMGSRKADDDMAYTDEEPRHPVTISKAFRIAAHKTTQEQFEKVMGRNPSWFSATGGGKDKVGNLDTARFPVENVSFFDALEFCNKLSEKEQRTPCYRLASVERDNGSIKSAEVAVVNGTGPAAQRGRRGCAPTGATTRYWIGNTTRCLTTFGRQEQRRSQSSGRRRARGTSGLFTRRPGVGLV